MSDEFRRLLSEEVAEYEEAVLWEYRLAINEMLWGSAYGPWETPELTGLATVIEATS